MGKWSTYSRRGGGSAAGVVETYQLRIAAAGGSISAASLAAVAALYQALAIAGVWDKLTDVWPCVGNDLVSALVKLKVAPGTPTSYTNVAFVGGDYVESGGTGGLTGNGTTKCLTGGPTMLSFGSNCSLSCSCLAVTPSASNMGYMGIIAGTDQYWVGSTAANANTTSRLGQTIDAQLNTAMAAGFWTGSRLSATDNKLYKNGVQQATVATNTTPGADANNSDFFAWRNGAGHTAFLNGRLAGGAFGIGLTAQNVLDLFNAWAQFNTTIGR